MEFDDWAEQYALDDDYPTRDGRRFDCRAAWDAAATATRKTCEVACAQALEYAQGAEREACAKVCEGIFNDMATWESHNGLTCAEAIRKRSNGQAQPGRTG